MTQVGTQAEQASEALRHHARGEQALRGRVEGRSHRGLGHSLEQRMVRIDGHPMRALPLRAGPGVVR